MATASRPGTGARAAYPQQLAKIIGLPVVNAGLHGETSGEARARLPKVLAQNKPQLLILCSGGNDFLRRLPAKQTEENINAMVEAAKAAGAEVALIAVPRVFPFLSNHPLYGRVARKHGLWLEAAVLKTTMANAALMSDDHIHPNDAGYAAIARGVAALLKQAGAV